MSIEEKGEESSEPEGRIIMDDPLIRVAPADSPREFAIPVLLLAIGFVALLSSAIAIGGRGRGALAAGVLFALVLLVELPLTIAVISFLGATLGISYGLLRSALLKLAAITIFALGFSLMGDAFGHPFLTQIALMPVSWYLFGALFELDAWETLVSMIVFSLLGATFYHVLGWLVDGALRWLG
jgi:hypothetical protein